MNSASIYMTSSSVIDYSEASAAPDNLNGKEVFLTVKPSLILNIQSLPSLHPASETNSQARASISGRVCRICHEDGIQEELISPCFCAGTLGMAHASCIEKWLSSSNTTCCEICQHQYNLCRKPKSVFEWLKAKSPLNGPSGFCGDVFCLLLLTPLCIGSVYLCAIGARAYIKHGLWEGTGLAMLCCFLMAVYILWCFVAISYQEVIEVPNQNPNLKWAKSLAQLLASLLAIRGVS